MTRTSYTSVSRIHSVRQVLNLPVAASTLLGGVVTVTIAGATTASTATAATRVSITLH
jgi:hypothetical protein